MTAITGPLKTPVATNRIDYVVSGAESHIEATVEADERPKYTAIYVSSIAAMSLLFFLGVGIPCAIVYGNATGWGVGAFCAFWGGPGFGVMAAGARVSTWQEKHEMDH